MKTSALKIIVCLFFVAIVMGVSCFAAMQAMKYDVHDKTRENPPVIEPPKQFGQPPSDAIVLFDGEDTSLWVSERKGGGEVPWKIENGYMEVTSKGGGIRTKKDFGNCQLHVEWCTPKGIDPAVTDQKRSRLSDGQIRGAGARLLYREQLQGQQDIRRRPGGGDLRLASANGQRLPETGPVADL